MERSIFIFVPTRAQEKRKIQTKPNEVLHMANFRGTVQGSRGIASRLGHSYLDVQANSWNSGVRIAARYNDITGRNEFSVFITGGSNAPSDLLNGYLGKIVETEKGSVFVPANN